MDRSDLESDRRLYRPVAWLHQLLRHANGCALAGYGYDEICGHHAQVWQTPYLDRAREHRRCCAYGAAELEKTAAHLRQFDVGPFSGTGKRTIYPPSLARHGTGALALVSGADQAT